MEGGLCSTGSREGRHFIARLAYKARSPLIVAALIAGCPEGHPSFKSEHYLEYAGFEVARRH